MKLEGKVAVVTGGSKGIGLAVAKRYAQEGATVAVVSRKQEDCDAAANEINAAGGKAFGIACDVSDLAQHQKLIDAVVEKAGKIDILFNNAGVFDARLLLDLTEEHWDYVWDINVKGAAFMLQKAAQQMVKQGHGGRIINVSSEAGRRGARLCFHYGAGKAALIHMTQTAAFELAEHGINVNGIAPGVIDTDMWVKVDRQFGEDAGKQPGEVKAELDKMVPYGRFGVVDDMTGAAVFLASDDSEYMIAQTLNVDGGRVPG